MCYRLSRWIRKVCGLDFLWQWFPQETLPSKKTSEGILWDLWECPVVATATLLKRESNITFLNGELVIF